MNKPKFKVGDKVRVASVNGLLSNGGIAYIGVIGVIAAVSTYVHFETDYKVVLPQFMTGNEDDIDFIYLEEQDLELVEE